MSKNNAVNEKESAVVQPQRILDGLWVCTCCGIVGEVIGIVAARYCLAAWMIWTGAVAGVCLGVLSVFFPAIGKTVHATWLLLARTSSYLFQLLKGLSQSTFKRRKLTVDVVQQQLKQYSEQRRWIACENVVRQFLANCPINSPNLAAKLYDVAKRIECCRSQFIFLIWYVAGGFMFTFISYHLLQSQKNFPALLAKVLPFLHDWQDNIWASILSNGLLVAMWFILISFAINILLLLLHKKIIYWGSGWAVLVCFLLVAFSLMPFVLSNVAETDVVEVVQKIQQSEKILVALAMLMLLRSLVLNMAINGINQAHPPILSLLIWSALLMLAAQLPFGLYLPESVCFCVLIASTGMLNSEQNTLKQRWSWLLIPFCCLFAVFLNASLESGMVVLFAIGTALLIGGFLIAAEKSFHSFVTLAFYATIVVIAGYFLRRFMKAPDIALTLIAVWSTVNLWQLLSHLEQYNTRISIFDILQKVFLRIRLRNTEFGKKDLVDTQWYKTNSGRLPVPPKKH